MHGLLRLIIFTVSQVHRGEGTPMEGVSGLGLGLGVSGLIPVIKCFSLFQFKLSIYVLSHDFEKVQIAKLISKI